MDRAAQETRTGDAGVGERLAGQKILLTGGSGFVGKGVLAALLRSAPDVGEIVVALRATDEEGAKRRLLDEVFGSDAFADIAGDEIAERVRDGRIRALAADLEGDDLERPQGDAWDGVDTVIHCAATVSFEEALDDALILNSFGPSRLLQRLRAAGSEPHFVHVSTAYVADRGKGRVMEDGLPHDALAAIDADALLAEARELRATVERESAAEKQRSSFAAAAKRDASRRSDLDPAERAEELRRRWVRERLSRLSRRRAMELGWADTYALSKAIGERLLAEREARTTVIRPTIIESALTQPNPGWLEGIKVADPLILAYASRGLTHLPGREDNVIDIVPVDHVANACVVAAAHPPASSPRTIAIGSSARNPLSIGRLAEEIRRYFLQHPLHGRGGKPIEIGVLQFVDREVALRKTLRRERLAAAAARVAIASPIRIPQERMLRSTRSLAERVTRMVKIYGAYTELDCVFDDTNACELSRSLSAADRAALPFDTAAIEWDTYLQEIHLPSVHALAEGG